MWIKHIHEYWSTPYCSLLWRNMKCICSWALSWIWPNVMSFGMEKRVLHTESWHTPTVYHMFLHNLSWFKEEGKKGIAELLPFYSLYFCPTLHSSQIPSWVFFCATRVLIKAWSGLLLPRGCEQATSQVLSLLNTHTHMQMHWSFLRSFTW